ncbi:MAG: type II secretion system GspH family protein [Polyangiaceae bacterium]|nr:type II secretion system GspH family protein [Polyangiaceae bacterium]
MSPGSVLERIGEIKMKDQLVNSKKTMGRAVARGMTLIEIMIVVAIIAMVAGGVAVVAIPKMKEAQIKTTQTAARVIRNAVSQWQLAENEFGTCPTVSQMIDDKVLDSGQNTDDPWGEPFVITCEDDEVVVSSSGPDKKKGTKDDISIPQGAQVED